VRRERLQQIGDSRERHHEEGKPSSKGHDDEAKNACNKLSLQKGVIARKAKLH
jgi:hypothetical protein